MTRRSIHTDETRFIVSVLYASGIPSTNEIAAALGITRGTVAGLIDREHDGKLRHMTIEQRQAFLDRAKKARMDRGRLEDRYFTAKERKGRR